MSVVLSPYPHMCTSFGHINNPYLEPGSTVVLAIYYGSEDELEDLDKVPSPAIAYRGKLIYGSIPKSGALD